MSLKGFWIRRAQQSHVTPRVEAEPVELLDGDNVAHIAAAIQNSGITNWCHVTKNGWNKLRPNATSVPAEEATLFRYRPEFITCTSCLWMHKRFGARATFMT